MISLPPYPNNSSAAQWSGLTLREIEMRRTLVQARMEIQKFKLEAQVEGMRRRGPIFGGPDSLFSRLSGAFTFAEYGFVAIKALKLASSLFRRKR